MRVVHIIQHIGLQGGIEVLVEQMVLHSQEAGKEVFVYSLSSGQKSIPDDWPLAPYVSYGTHAGLSWAEVTKLASWLQAHRIDVVITHHIGPLLYGGVASRMAGIKHRVHVDHDAWFGSKLYNRLLHRLGMLVMQPKWVAVSQTVRDQWQRYSSYPCEVIYNGIDEKRFIKRNKKQSRERLALPGDAYLVGFVGRLEHVKGPDRLLLALAKLPEHVHVVIVGSGSLSESLHRTVHELGLEERVHFLGFRDDTESIYPALDVLCMPSRHEGYPLTLLEAQACQIPTVAFDVGGVKDCFPVSRQGLVPDGDLDVLANALLQAKSIGVTELKAIRKHIEMYNSLRAMIGFYERLYLP